MAQDIKVTSPLRLFVANLISDLATASCRDERAVDEKKERLWGEFLHIMSRPTFPVGEVEAVPPFLIQYFMDARGVPTANVRVTADTVVYVEAFSPEELKSELLKLGFVRVRS